MSGARSGQRGFGLVEMLIAVSLMSLLVAGSYKALVTSQETSVARAARNSTRQGARIAVQRMATELRMAGYGVKPGSPAIVSGSGTRLSFEGDVDNGSDDAPCVDESLVADGGVERITYELRGTQLLRAVQCWDGVAWQPEGVASPIAIVDPEAGGAFRYFSETGIQLHPGSGLSAQQREDVALVDIELHALDPEMIAQVADLDHLNTYFLKIGVKIRNRGS